MGFKLGESGIVGTRTVSAGMGSPGKTSTRKLSLLGNLEGRLWRVSRSGPAAVARREPDGMTSSAAPVWNAAGEGVGCPVLVRPPPASRSRSGVAEGPWDPFPSTALAGMRADCPRLALCPPPGLGLYPPILGPQRPPAT